MSRMMPVTERLIAYVTDVGAREAPALRRCREETAKLPMSQMQIGPDQGAFMALLAKLIGARRYLEIGTFTGYSALAVALALPVDGKVVACDIRGPREQVLPEVTGLLVPPASAAELARASPGQRPVPPSGAIRRLAGRRLQPDDHGDRQARPHRQSVLARLHGR